VTLTFDFFNLKIGTSLTHAPGNVYTNFDFATFLFLSYEPVQDRQIDRHTDRQDVMWPIERLHNKIKGSAVGLSLTWHNCGKVEQFN